MDKQFKQRGYNYQSIICPTEELKGLPFKVNYKFMCSSNDDKKLALKKLRVKCNHCQCAITFEGKVIMNKPYGFVDVECSNCDQLASVSCYSDDEIR